MNRPNLWNLEMGFHEICVRVCHDNSTRSVGLRDTLRLVRCRGLTEHEVCLCCLRLPVATSIAAAAARNPADNWTG